MTNDEIKRKQEETLNNLKKYNKDRKTEFITDPDFDDKPNEDVLDTFERAERGAPQPSMQEWLDEQDRLNNQRGVTVEEATEPDEKFMPRNNPIMSHICPYCGMMAYIGQIHGLGYCTEKVKYEE